MSKPPRTVTSMESSLRRRSRRSTSITRRMLREFGATLPIAGSPRRREGKTAKSTGKCRRSVRSGTAIEQAEVPPDHAILAVSLSQQASRPFLRAALTTESGRETFMRTTVAAVLVVCLGFAVRADAAAASRREATSDSRDRRELSRRDRRVPLGPDARDRHHQRIARDHRSRHRLRRRTSASRRARSSSSRSCCGRPRSTSSASNTRRSTTSAQATLKRTSSSTASLPDRAAGRHRAEVEGLPVRLRVRLRLPRPRVRRPGARSEVHRRRGDAAERDRHRVRPRARADPGGRRHRPRLRRRRTSRSPASSRSSSCPRHRRATTAAKYYDFDLYGTVNFTDHFGAQGGYRSFDVFYNVDEDEGDLKLKGLYFGGVVRF